MEDIHSKLQEIKNPINAIGVLIRDMDYEADVELERRFNIGEINGHFPICCHPVVQVWDGLFPISWEAVLQRRQLTRA